MIPILSDCINITNTQHFLLINLTISNIVIAAILALAHILVLVNVFKDEWSLPQS